MLKEKRSITQYNKVLKTWYRYRIPNYALVIHQYEEVCHVEIRIFKIKVPKFITICSITNETIKTI